MKLEAGKYYLTCHGSKVGPMVEFINGKWFYCDGVAEVWNADGKNRYSGIDIIAEWHDEAAPLTPYGEALASTRAHILDTAKRAVTADRNTTHGKPEDTFGDIAEMWSVYVGKAISAHDVAAMMALLKICRAKSNPRNEDNWVDLAGYAACGGELAG